MKFEKLLQLVTEAKNETETGAYYRAQQREGPAGITASPIGTSSYNPSIEPVKSKDPADKGGNAVNTIKLLGKAFQVLKNDDVFADQMRGIMNGFKKNRRQISSYQESVIKTKPKVIDNLWGQIDRLIRIVNDPKKREDPDHPKFVQELDTVKTRKDEHQAELDQVYSEIDSVISDNESYDEEYLSQMRGVSRRIYICA